MNLEEAIEWAERDVKNLSGVVEVSIIVYYVVPWNDGYVVFPESHIKRHPDIEWVYNTKEKWIKKT